MLTHGIRGIRYARVGLSNGIVQGGHILDSERFKQVLLATMSKVILPLKKHQVVVGLPEEHAFTKSVELPAKLHAHEIATVIENQWQSLIPVPRDQVYFTCIPLKEKKAPKANTQKILIIAYPRDIIGSILVTLTNAQLTPLTFIPISFGLAELFSREDHQPSLVLLSEDGTSISVFVVENKTTRFSTTIHTAVTDPSSAKQLDNIRTYFEKNLSTDKKKLSEIIIILNRFAEDMSRQLATVGLPIRIASAGLLKTSASQDREEIEHFLAHEGLLRSKTNYSILPPELAEAILVQRQGDIFRATLAYMIPTFIIVAYFSAVFWGALRINSRSRSQANQDIPPGIISEQQELLTKVREVNQEIFQFASARSKTVHYAGLLQEIYLASKKFPDLTITSATISAENSSLEISGTTKDESATPKFTESLKAGLKADARFSKPEVEIKKTSSQSFTIEIKAGGA